MLPLLLKMRSKRARQVWSVAATQLDQINVDAGNGHQEVYLDTTGVGGRDDRRQMYTAGKSRRALRLNDTPTIAGPGPAGLATAKLCS